MKKIIISFTLLVSIIIFSSCYGSQADTAYLQEKKPEFEYHDNPIALIDDSVIYHSFTDDGGMLLKRYYINENRIIEFGRIDNMLVTNSKPAGVKNSLYLYVTVGEENKVKNALYHIDTEHNTIEETMFDYNPSHFIPMTSFGEAVLSISGGRQNESKGLTSIQAYHPETGDTAYPIQCKVDYRLVNGEVIVGIRGDNDTLYILKDIGISGKIKRKIEAYNIQYQLINEYGFANEFGDFFDSPISIFYVKDSYVFIRNFSGDGVIGKIEDNQISLILRESELDIANMDNKADKTLLYIRNTNDYIIIDTKKDTLENHSVALFNGHVIKSVLFNGDKAWISLYPYESDNNDNDKHIYADILEYINLSTD